MGRRAAGALRGGAGTWRLHNGRRRQAGFPVIPGVAKRKTAKGDGGLAAAAIA